MLHVACCLWDANDKTLEFSRCYDEVWVDKLYRGFKRNLTRPFRFICLTDRRRTFGEPAIEQERLSADRPDYGCMIEPFRLNKPMMIVGLDTVILGNIDHMADYCLFGEKIALPLHPARPDLGAINPIVFVTAGHRKVFDDWRGENDMDWLRAQDTVYSDSMWPGEILSWKLHHLRERGPMDAKIVYWHGHPKPNKLAKTFDWVREAWQ